MKSKLKKILKNMLFIMLFSLVFLGIGYLLAIFISHQFYYKMQDIMFYEGLIFILFGVLFSMKSNPSGVNLQGLGMTNPQYFSNQNLDVTRLERETTDCYKDFLKSSMVEFAFSNITIIVSGILIIVLSVFCT